MSTSLARRLQTRAGGRPSLRTAQRGVDLARRWEPWVAGPCAVALLLYPHPLVGPAAVLGALPSVARWRSQGRPWRRTAFDLPFVLLAVGTLLGAWAGLSQEATGLRLSGLLAGLILYATILEQAQTPTRLRNLTGVLLAGATIGTVILLFVVAPYLELGRVPPLAGLVGALDPHGALGRINWDDAWDDALLQRYRLRASGIGALAAVGLAVVFAVATGTRSRPRRAALSALGLLFGLVLLAADNRGAMLASGLTLGTLAAFWRPRLLPLVPVGGLVVLGAIAGGLVERGLSIRTINQRLWFWDNSLYLARELPLTGAGLGTQSVQATYQAYFQPTSPSFSHAHSIYLQGLLETGLVGLVGLVGLALAALWVGWTSPAIGRRSGATADRAVRAAGLAGLGAALALFTAGLSEIVALSTIGGALLCAALGLLAAADAWGRDESQAGGDARSAGKTAPSTSGGGRQRGWTGFTARRERVAGAAAALVALALLVLVTGLGRQVAALILLNVGSVELNRATLSKDTGRAARAGGLERSVGLLRAAASLDQANATVQRNLALALAAQEDRRARAAADRTRSLTPADDRRGQFQVGRAYASLNAWGEAIRTWQAIGATPQLLQLGNRLVRSRNWSQALAAYEAVLAVQPTSRGAYEGIARMGRDRDGSTEGAIGALEPWLTRRGDYEYQARLQMARIYREDDQPRRALDLLGPVTPGYPEASLEHGLALAQLGRWSQAEPLLAELAPILWHDAELFLWLARSRAELDDHVGAIAAARTGLELIEPRKGAERAPFLARIGDSLLALDRPREAIATFEEGVSGAPRDGPLRDGVTRAQAALEQQRTPRR